MSDQSLPQRKAPPEIANLTGFPLPPSANGLYKSVGRRRAKSSDYLAFERSAIAWMRWHTIEIDEARELTLLTGPNRYIHIDCVFYMLRERIICKSGLPKKNDTSNRLKALHDALSQILGIDDCYFFSGSFDKVAVDDPSEVGVDVTMVISEYKERDRCSSPP